MTDYKGEIAWIEKGEICIICPPGSKTPKRNLKVGEWTRKYVELLQRGETVIYRTDQAGKSLTYIKPVQVDKPVEKFQPANQLTGFGRTAGVDPAIVGINAAMKEEAEKKAAESQKEEVKDCTSPAPLPDIPIPMAARTVTIAAHVNLSNYENIQVQVSQVCNNQLDRENLIKYFDETLGMFGSDEQIKEMIGSYRRRVLGKGVE